MSNYETNIPSGANAQEKPSLLNRINRRRLFVKVAAVAAGLALIWLGLMASPQYRRFKDRRFLRESAYPPELYDWQHKLRKLSLTDERLNLERFTWLSSDSIEELALQSSHLNNVELALHIDGEQAPNLDQLAKLSNLTDLTLNLFGSKVSDLGPLAKLNNLRRLRLNLVGSRAPDLEPLSRITSLRTHSIENATGAQRMSLRNIPAGLVELKFETKLGLDFESNFNLKF